MSSEAQKLKNEIATRKNILNLGSINNNSLISSEALDEFISAAHKLQKKHFKKMEAKK